MISRKKSHFCSQAIVADRTVYVSGCLGIDNDAKLVDGGAGAQTKKALENLGRVLEAAGSSFDRIVKSTVFIINMEDYKAVNEEYSKGKKEQTEAERFYKVFTLYMFQCSMEDFRHDHVLPLKSCRLKLRSRLKWSL